MAKGNVCDEIDCDGTERVTIHSPRLNVNIYLMNLMNAGIWLGEKAPIKTSRKRTIEIILHPVGSPWIRWLRVLCDPLKFPGFVRRHHFARTRSVTNALDWFKRSCGRGLVDTICSHSSGVRIHVNERVALHIRLIKLEYLQTIGPTLVALGTALRYWALCVENRRLNVQRFLLLHHRGVHIGDLIASESLRRDPDAGGSLRRCGRFGMFWLLVGAVHTTDYVDSIEWQPHPLAYVTTPEPTYLEAIYRRALAREGFRILELHDYAKPLRIIHSAEDTRNPYVAQRNKTIKLSLHQQEKVRQYLDERLSDPSQHLPYMYSGQNSNDIAFVPSINGHSIAANHTSLTMVLFLHNFDDAQYSFGLDGFEDLYDWTIISIEKCLKNRDVGRILVKAHPNTDAEHYPGDKKAIDELRHRYSNEARVIFIDPHTSITAISSLGLVYGLTHHGSVAEELVAVGVPVIASSKAPWGETYPFLRVWNSPREYADILADLHAASWLPPDNTQKEALAQFVNEYRLRVEPERHHESWFQWMAWADKTTYKLSRGSYMEAARRIEALEINSQTLLEWLRERASAYRMREAVSAKEAR